MEPSNSQLVLWVITLLRSVLQSRRPLLTLMLRMVKASVIFVHWKKADKPSLPTLASLCLFGLMPFSLLSTSITACPLPPCQLMLHPMSLLHARNPISLIYVYGGVSVLLLSPMNFSPRQVLSDLRLFLSAMRKHALDGEFVT